LKGQRFIPIWDEPLAFQALDLIVQREALVAIVHQ